MEEKKPLEKKKKEVKKEVTETVTKEEPKKEEVKAEEVKTEEPKKEEKPEEVKTEEPKKEVVKPVGNKKIFDNKMIPIIVAVAVVAILLVLGIFVIKGGRNSLGKPILFVEDDQLILWNKDQKKKIVVDDRYDTDENSYLYAAFMNKSNNMVAYVNDESLYIYNVKKNQKDKIASNVSSSIYFSKDDKYIIYKDKDGSIYYYDIKKQDKNKIVSDHDDEDNYVISVVDGGVIYRIQDEDYNDTLYFYSFGKNPENNKIAADVEDYEFTEDKTKLMYSVEKEDDVEALYTYDFKKKKNTKILEEAADIISYNDDFTKIIYVQVSEEAGYLDDDEKGKDPTTTSQQLCTYSAYKKGDCSRTDWLYDRYYTATISKKEINDSIRKKAVTYDVYSYENGKSKKLVSNVTNVLAASADTGIVLYQEADIDEKVKISSFKSLEEFESYLDKMKTKVSYQKGTGKAVSLDVEFDEIDKAVITKSAEGYVLDEDDDLYFIDMKKNSSKLEMVDSDVSGMAVYDIGLLYGTDMDDDDDSITMTIKLASKKTGKVIAEDVSNFTVEDGKLYLYHDCSKDSCDYSVYDKKLKEISKDVYRVIEIDSNNYYEFKNYSSKKDTVDLYIRTKGKSEKIAYDLETDYLKCRIED